MSNVLEGLLTADAARTRSREVLHAVETGEGLAFRLDRSRLADVAEYVATTTREAYPDLNIPPHSRWRHFEQPDGASDWEAAAERATWRDPRARAMAEIDLAFVSVLLDAGAGADWAYRTTDGRTLGRSEGLAAASLAMFAAGAFSSDPENPLQADANGLAALTDASLAKGMQSGSWSAGGASLIGLDGRRILLANLARAMRTAPEIFGADGRPGGLFDWVKRTGADAPDLLALLLRRLAPIWPQGRQIDNVALGDVWRHRAVRRDDATDGLAPFHKLSQWLAYSLTEPFARAGTPLAHVDGLTGLAEYRNGGLFVDLGVLTPLDQDAFDRVHAAGDPLTVEWRACTLALLDDLLPFVRDALERPDLDLPQLLQGGTWSAGRKIARARRPGGPPPFSIASDGTLF